MEEGKGVIFHYRLLPLFSFHVRTHCVFPPIELEPDEENDVIYLHYTMGEREGGGEGVCWKFIHLDSECVKPHTHFFVHVEE